MGFSTAYHYDIEALVEHRLKEVFIESGDRKISLIGQSLGGAYAKFLARRYPNVIRDVVTLGGPISGDTSDVSVWRIYQWVSKMQFSRSRIPAQAARAQSAAGGRPDHRAVLQEGRHRALAQCARKARPAGAEHRGRRGAHRDGIRRLRALPRRAPACQVVRRNVAAARRADARPALPARARAALSARISGATMERLTGLESLYLRLETDSMPMNASSLTIYDRSAAPGGKVEFADIQRYIAERAHRAGIFRRRLATLPLSIARPYWVDDPGFDIEFHVRHIALPRPGDWRQLCTQVARLHARPLDRSRPLWECYVVEELDNIQGLPPGSFALFFKTHFAAARRRACGAAFFGDARARARRARVGPQTPPLLRSSADARRSCGTGNGRYGRHAHGPGALRGRKHGPARAPRQPGGRRAGSSRAARRARQGDRRSTCRRRAPVSIIRSLRTGSSKASASRWPRSSG